MRQERLYRLLVADEIVVDEIDVPAVTELVERLQLFQHLLRRLGPWHPAVQLDDVAELAGERTAARILHADVHVVLELEQIEARLRRLGDVDLVLRRLEQALVAAGLDRGDELVDDAFGLPHHAEVRPLVDVRTRRHVGAADGDLLAALAAQIDEVKRARLLEQHAAGQHQVGPFQILVEQLLGIAVDQADVPVGRQHGRDRDQPQRNGRIAGADDLAGFAIVPERFVAEARIDQQHVAAVRRRNGSASVELRCQHNPIPRDGTRRSPQYGEIARFFKAKARRLGIARTIGNVACKQSVIASSFAMSLARDYGVRTIRELDGDGLAPLSRR